MKKMGFAFVLATVALSGVIVACGGEDFGSCEANNSCGSATGGTDGKHRHPGIEGTAQFPGGAEGGHFFFGILPAVEAEHRLVLTTRNRDRGERGAGPWST